MEKVLGYIIEKGVVVLWNVAVVGRCDVRRFAVQSLGRGFASKSCIVLWLMDVVDGLWTGGEGERDGEV